MHVTARPPLLGGGGAPKAACEKYTAMLSMPQHERPTSCRVRHAKIAAPRSLYCQVRPFCSAKILPAKLFLGLIF